MERLILVTMYRVITSSVNMLQGSVFDMHDDDRARHMYKKMGFKEYGMNLRAFKLKDGTYRDEIIMAKIFE